VSRYLFFLLVLFVIAAILRIDFFFTIGYLLFGLFVLGRLWIQRGLKGMRLTRSFTGRAFTGDDVLVRVTLHNTGRLPVPWVQTHESLPVELIAPPFHREVFSLAAGEQRYFEYELHCRRRGVYPLGPLRAQAGDLLGLEPAQQVELAPEPMVVYPQVVAMARLGVPTHSPLVALPAGMPLFEDPARVTGVRDYQRGDSPRRIHWTATASAGRLLVKQYQPAIARETMLCLDMALEGYGLRRRYEASELAVVVAASLANHIIVRERLPVGLTTEAADGQSERATQFFLPARRERGHLMSVLEALARVQLAQAQPLAERLRHVRARLAWGTTLIAITGAAGDDLFDSLATLRHAGLVVALVLVQAEVTTATQARARLLGVPIRQVWREKDLEGWR
jgi:uncharacterized protein (DUF58 family)